MKGWKSKLNHEVYNTKKKTPSESCLNQPWIKQNLIYINMQTKF
jgi:hypothetical protein